MFEVVMSKLSKPDIIDSRKQAIEKDLNEVKSSVEFVHAEVQDLKKWRTRSPRKQKKKRNKGYRIMNSVLNNRVIDFQARSMCDNLIF